MECELGDRDVSEHRLKNIFGLRGYADADGVPQAELVDAEVEQPAGEVNHRVDGGRTLVRTAPDDREVGADPHTGIQSPFRHGTGDLERLGDGLVDVLA